MAETPQDKAMKRRRSASSFRGEDESAEVEGHMKTREPAERLAARGEDESPEVEGHIREPVRARDEDERESPEKARLAARQPEERS